uniref:tubby C-terminal domain-like protein n=1 Tax=Metabacillus herbersteinensis TaxID=283816 RepID=UPI00366B5703
MVDKLFDRKDMRGKLSSSEIAINERSFRENLIKMKWDVKVNDDNSEETLLLEDLSKVSTNQCFLYHKGERAILFKRDVLSRKTVDCFHDTGEVITEIRTKKMVPKTLEFTLNSDTINQVEVAAIFYTICLTYNK